MFVDCLNGSQADATMRRSECSSFFDEGFAERIGNAKLSGVFFDRCHFHLKFSKYNKLKWSVKPQPHWDTFSGHFRWRQDPRWSTEATASWRLLPVVLPLVPRPFHGPHRR